MVKKTFLVLALVITTYFIYQPVLKADYLNLDDMHYLFMTPNVYEGLSINSVQWAWRTMFLNNYAPIVWMSHQAVFTFTGNDDPYWHHFTNLAFHIVNVILLFLTMWRFTGQFWESLAIASLFAIHPLSVEPVAWISSRKDVLSVFFGLLSLISYSFWVQKQTFKYYILCTLLLVCSLLCKPMLVTFPIILLLLDYWPLRRSNFKNLLREKIPLFIIVTCFSLIAIYAQHNGHGLVELDAVPMDYRISASFVNYVSYMKGYFDPDPVAFYPMISNLPYGQAAVSVGIIIIIGLLALIRPYLTVGVFWLFITLMPVIGILQNGSQRIADRYMYFPAIGLSIASVFLISELSKKYTKIPIIIGFVCITSIFATKTHEYSKKWINGSELFSYTYSKRPSATSAELAAVEYLNQRDFANARFYLLQTLDIEPMRVTALIRLAAITLENDKQAGIDLLNRVDWKYMGDPVAGPYWQDVNSRLRHWAGIEPLQIAELPDGWKPLEELLK